jgi:transposase
MVGGKRPYYRPTTADQRKLLFQVYEQTDSPRKACAAAHVGIGTLYYWRKRFEAGGYAALEEVKSHAPHSFPNQLSASVVEAVIEAKREHPEWGRRRIADELRKAQGWQPVVSASEVQRILMEAGLWSKVARYPKR